MTTIPQNIIKPKNNVSEPIINTTGDTKQHIQDNVSVNVATFLGVCF